MDHWEKIVKIMATIGGAIAGFFGEWNEMLTCLAIAMVMDYLGGLIVAWSGKSPKSETGGISSEVGFRGLAKKGFIILVVIAATILDKLVGQGSVFQMAVVFYYIANELMSILENAAIMGVPLPKSLLNGLDVIKKSADEKIPDTIKAMTSGKPNEIKEQTERTEPPDPD